MLLALGSVKSSPGVTTAAVALGARWPARDVPVVVEADPAGGDLLARYRMEPYPGLVSLAAAARRGADPGLLWRHTQPLPGGLPVVVGAMGGEQARAAVTELLAAEGVPVLRRAEPSTTPADPAAAGTGTGGGRGIHGNAAGAGGRVVVLADCGRLDSLSAAVPLVRAADALVLLTRPVAAELAHLAALLPALAGWCPRIGLVLVGSGYGAVDVERLLGAPVLGRLPHDPAGARVLRGVPGRAWPAKSALGRAAGGLARLISTRAIGPIPEVRPVEPRTDQRAVPGRRAGAGTGS
jgi:hypothetical protein